MYSVWASAKVPVTDLFLDVCRGGEGERAIRKQLLYTKKVSPQPPGNFVSAQGLFAINPLSLFPAQGNGAASRMPIKIRILPVEHRFLNNRKDKLNNRKDKLTSSSRAGTFLGKKAPVVPQGTSC
jgi:hypothetical protein